jgi:cellulose biosynthesis protein BcsQ
VAKTTTTYHVGCSLAQHYGKKVLLIDIDPQTNLTFLCAPVEKWKEFKKKTGTIANMYQKYLDKKSIDTKLFIWRSPIEFARQRIPNLDLIPCDIDLLGEDLGGGQITGTFPSLELLKRQAAEYLRDRMFMRKALSEVQDYYDYILIDCPPNLYLMTQNALAASRWYIVTAIPDHLSTIAGGAYVALFAMYAAKGRPPKGMALSSWLFVRGNLPCLNRREPGGFPYKTRGRDAMAHVTQALAAGGSCVVAQAFTACGSFFI